MKSAHLIIFACAFAVAGIIIYAALRGEIGTIERQATDLISEAEKTVCPKYFGPRYVKIGDLVFAVPPDVKIFSGLRENYAQGGDFERKCANSVANAQELRELMLRLDTVNFGEDAAKLPSLRGGFISLYSPVGGVATFSNAVKGRSIKNRKLDTYPQDGGFYRIPIVKYSFFLVSSDPAFKLENGDPLAFECATSGVPKGRMECRSNFPIEKNTGISLMDINLKQTAFKELSAIYIATKRVAKEWQAEAALQK